MKKYVLDDLKDFERIEDYIICPTGDYSKIKAFPVGNTYAFGPFSVFGNNTDFGYVQDDTYNLFSPRCSFGAGCTFAGKTSFASMCSFGCNCKFGPLSDFGPCCDFGQRCIFEGLDDFANACQFEEFCQFGECTNFGEGCDFAMGTVFRENTLFGNRCSFHESCVPLNQIDYICEQISECEPEEDDEHNDTNKVIKNNTTFDELIQRLLIGCSALDELLLLNAATVLKYLDKNSGSIGKYTNLISLNSLIQNFQGRGYFMVNEFAKIPCSTEAEFKKNTDIKIWFSNYYFSEGSKEYERTLEIRSRVAKMAWHDNLGCHFENENTDIDNNDEEDNESIDCEDDEVFFVLANFLRQIW